MNSSEKLPKRPIVSRRQFGYGVSSFALIGLTGMTNASAATQTDGLPLEESLQKALYLIGSSASRKAADDLGQRAFGSSGFSFHLRRADITADGAAIVGNALASLSQVERARLRSFSLSYNEIGDDGAIALAAALPETLRELGMVGCSISDRGGEELRKWAANAQGLGMICIEGNAMSKAMRDEYIQLGKSSPSLAVFV